MITLVIENLDFLIDICLDIGQKALVVVSSVKSDVEVRKTRKKLYFAVVVKLANKD